MKAQYLGRAVFLCETLNGHGIFILLRRIPRRVLRG